MAARFPSRRIHQPQGYTVPEHPDRVLAFLQQPLEALLWGGLPRAAAIDALGDGVEVGADRHFLHQELGNSVGSIHHPGGGQGLVVVIELHRDRRLQGRGSLQIALLPAEHLRHEGREAGGHAGPGTVLAQLMVFQQVAQAPLPIGQHRCGALGEDPQAVEHHGLHHQAHGVGHALPLFVGVDPRGTGGHQGVASRGQR